MKFPDHSYLGTITIEDVGEFRVTMTRIGTLAPTPPDALRETLERLHAIAKVEGWSEPRGTMFAYVHHPDCDDRCWVVRTLAPTPPDALRDPMKWWDSPVGEWISHHDWCKAIGGAGTCDCGLAEATLAPTPPDAPDVRGVHVHDGECVSLNALRAALQPKLDLAATSTWWSWTYPPEEPALKVDPTTVSDTNCLDRAAAREDAMSDLMARRDWLIGKINFLLDGEDVPRSAVVRYVDEAFDPLIAAIPTPPDAPDVHCIGCDGSYRCQGVAATPPDALREAAQETLGAFYVSPGVTTGRQAKALDALRAALGSER